MMWKVVNKLNDKIIDKIAGNIFDELYRKASVLFMLAAYIIISFLLITASLYVSAIAITGHHAVGIGLVREMLNLDFSAAWGLISDIWYGHNLFSQMPFGTVFGYIGDFAHAMRSGNYALFDDAILDVFDNIFLYDGFLSLFFSVLADNLRTTYTGFLVYVLAFFVGDRILGFITVEPLKRTAHEVGFIKFWCIKIGSFIGRFSVALSTMFLSFAIVNLMYIHFNHAHEFTLYLFVGTNSFILSHVVPTIAHVLLLVLTIFVSRVIYNAKVAKRPSPPAPEAASKEFWRKYQKAYTRQLSTWVGAFLFYFAGTNARIVIFIVWLAVVGLIDKQIVFND